MFKMRDDQEGLARPQAIRNYSSEHENAPKPGQLTFALISLFNEVTINWEAARDRGCCHEARATVNAPCRRPAPPKRQGPQGVTARTRERHRIRAGATRSEQCMRDRDPPVASRPGGGREGGRDGRSDPRDAAVRPAARPARGACWGVFSLRNGPGPAPSCFPANDLSDESGDPAGTRPIPESP